MPEATFTATPEGIQKALNGIIIQFQGIYTQMQQERFLTMGIMEILEQQAEVLAYKEACIRLLDESIHPTSRPDDKAFSTWFEGEEFTMDMADLCDNYYNDRKRGKI